MDAKPPIEPARAEPPGIGRRDAPTGESVWARLPHRKRGVVYVSTGASFIEAARLSAQSVRRGAPDLPIVLFCDQPPAAPKPVSKDNPFDAIHPISNPHRRSKVDCLCQSPFERTLYLDSDTRAYADVSEALDVLDRFDIALAHAHARNRARTNAAWRIALPASYPQFNGGVIAYRSSESVLAFLREWRDAFHASGFRKDQVTLRELLWLSELRIATLPPEYNLRYLKYLPVWSRGEAVPKILHLSGYSRPGWRAQALDWALAKILRKRVAPAPAAGDGS